MPTGRTPYTQPVPQPDPATRDLLHLSLTPGLGPVLLARLLETFGSPDRVLAATAVQLAAVRGFSPQKATKIAAGFRESAPLVQPELDLADRLGVTILPRSHPDYPPLLQLIHDPPPLLYVRGRLDARAQGLDHFTVGIVGSRQCSHYGTEQAERFAAGLASAGVTIVSGGARGVDTAAHRAALRVQGRTIAVLGCGLAVTYPPENGPLFEQIAKPTPQHEGPPGAVISELPLNTPPDAGNFPMRNRIISGLSLGILVVEAAKGSGALITARQAAEDHGREVYALPGRVDSPTSIGTLNLLKSGGAALVTEPADILAGLEHQARNLHEGAAAAPPTSLFPPDPTSSPHPTTPAPRGPTPQRPPTGRLRPLTSNADGSDGTNGQPDASAHTTGDSASGRSVLTPRQRSIIAALAEPRTLDELAQQTLLDTATLRAELTMLELRRAVNRQGSKFART
jgi:DNA processing protein